MLCSEPDVSTQLPTSGQLFGEITSPLKTNDHTLNNRMARRYLSGDDGAIVTGATRDKLYHAIAKALVSVISVSSDPNALPNQLTVESLASVIYGHAFGWNHLRSILHRRALLVKPHNVPRVWDAYARLAGIDLALRIGVYLILTRGSVESLDCLEWVSLNKRGELLKQILRDNGFTREKFAEEISVSNNTVDSWLDKGTRLSDRHLDAIAKAQATDTSPKLGSEISAELRRFYWFSDLVNLLSGYIGAERTSDIVHHVRLYAMTVYVVINGWVREKKGVEALFDILDRGRTSGWSVPVLENLQSYEDDTDWREDIKAEAVDWLTRVLAVNRQIFEEEVEEINKFTNGRLFEIWDINNPQAYELYKESKVLYDQGKVFESIAKLELATRLDPMDPANYHTLGSFRAGHGARIGDQAMVEMALQECWIAAELDPKWILPWTEIGWILVRDKRYQEALDHLQNVSEERKPLDAEYFAALGSAQGELGHTEEAFASFEKAVELGPNTLIHVLAAGCLAYTLGERGKLREYAKKARHISGDESLFMLLNRATPQ